MKKRELRLFKEDLLDQKLPEKSASTWRRTIRFWQNKRQAQRKAKKTANSSGGTTEDRKQLEDALKELAELKEKYGLN